jgi:DNA-binding MarR family transcriptional regulator
MQGADRVDELLATFREEQPETDMTPLEIAKRIARLSALTTEAVQRALEGFGVTYAEFDVLMTLRRAGRPYRLTPTRLAEASMLTTGGTSNILQRLGAAGLVEREPDPEDGRSSWVRLTARGIETTGDMGRATTAAYAALFERVPARTREALAALMREALLGLGDYARPSR